MALLREASLNRRLALPQEILATAIAQGELPPDTDTALMLKMLFGFCCLGATIQAVEALGSVPPVAAKIRFSSPEHLFSAEKVQAARASSGQPLPEALALGLLQHCQEEFTTLSLILPALYAAERVAALAPPARG